MNPFLQSFGKRVTGVLSGFDRLVLHGSFRLLSYTEGLLKYLCHHRILLKDFGEHSRALSDRVIDRSVLAAEQAQRPIVYLRSSQDRKEDLAREIATRDGIEAGPICVLKTLELCRSYEVARHAQTRRIELRSRPRKCLHLYHYLIHPVFGFCHVRLQTWYPFSLQMCLNGREWLSRQLDAAGIGYRRERNCFTQIDDLPAAQRWMNRQLNAPWKSLLAELTQQVNPVASEFQIHLPDGQSRPVDYYWSVPQSEWASDLMFASRQELIPLYDRMIRHGMACYGPGDVLRFFGRRVKQDGTPWANFPGEVTTDVKSRAEGVRIKHRCNGNSLKIYDKGNVLRFEATLYEPKDFRVLRRPEGQPAATPRWMRLRHSLADLRRRAEVSQAANERLIKAQAALESSQTLGELTAKLCQPVTRPARTKPNGTRVAARRFRALQPLSPPDTALLTAVSRPEFHQNGFRNRDLRPLLFPKTPAEIAQQRRQTAAVSRRLALLRAHGLIRKVPHTHRYVVTDNGNTTINAILASRNANAATLADLAI